MEWEICESRKIPVSAEVTKALLVRLIGSESEKSPDDAPIKYSSSRHDWVVNTCGSPDS